MRKTLYLLAALPAVYLPISYFWVVGHVAYCAFLHLDISPVGPPLWLGGQIAIYATYIQLPFYFVWAAFSTELSWRQRIAWLVIILLLNMFAMPYFLWCKYKGSTQAVFKMQFHKESPPQKSNRLWRGLAIGGWLSLFALAAFGAVIFTEHQSMTKMNMASWAGYAGRLQAKEWFQEGRYRLLELSTSDKMHFTGSNEGPFEVWTWTRYTNVPPVLFIPTADQEFVEELNNTMRCLWDKKELSGAALRPLDLAQHQPAILVPSN